MRKKQRKLALVAVSIFTLTLVLFVWYEFFGGRKAINYTDILVLNQEVFHGTTITPGLLTTLSVEKDTLNKLYIKDASQLIGKEAAHYIPAETPLVQKYFDEANVVLNEGQVIAQIPKTWITSMPQTLRRNDKVFLYATDIPSEQLEKQGKLIQARSNSDEQGVTEDNDVEVINIQKNEMVQLYETYVAYVKDGSNKEVSSVSADGRKDASSSVASVEIVTTAEDFKEIEKRVNEGSYLIIMYSDATDVTDTESEKGE